MTKERVSCMKFNIDASCQRLADSCQTRSIICQMYHSKIFLFLRIVDLNCRNKYIQTHRLHLELISKQFQIYLICDLQDIRTYLHASQRSLCLTIFFTTLPTEQLYSSVLRDAVHAHTLILIYVCHYYAANLVQHTKLHIFIYRIIALYRS